MYSHLILANTILKRSFAINRLITTRQLQAILYLTDVEHRQLTRIPLNNQPWSCFATGPVLPELHNKTACLGSAPVERYLRDAGGQYHVYDNDIIDICIDRVFRPVILLQDQDLADVVRYPEGAWD